MKGSLLLYNLKLNCLIFSTGLNGSLIIFIRTYTVNYRNTLDRLRVRMNIILFHKTNSVSATISLHYQVVSISHGWRLHVLGCVHMNTNTSPALYVTRIRVPANTSLHVSRWRRRGYGLPVNFTGTSIVFVQAVFLSKS